MATLTRAQAQLFEEPNIGMLATLRPDGTPHVTPVWVSWDGAAVVVNTTTDRAKYAHVERDPRVTVVVVDRNDPTRYVSVSGTAETTQEGALEHMLGLGRKYVGDDENVRASFEETVRESGDTRALVRVVPERVTHWNVGD